MWQEGFCKATVWSCEDKAWIPLETQDARDARAQGYLMEPAQKKELSLEKDLTTDMEMQGLEFG